MVTITELVDSGSNTGSNANTAAPALASTVTLTPVNDPPVIGGIPAGENNDVVAGAGFQNLDGFDDATVTNPDSGDYSGGSLRIAYTGGGNAFDVSFGLDGTTAQAIDPFTGFPVGNGIVINAAIEVNDGGGFVEIGTVSATEAGQGGNDLVITFNAASTNARVQILLRALTADVSSGLTTRDYLLTLNDGDADGAPDDATASFTIDVTGTPTRR
ncbi:MAG: hypothetical protein U5L06_07035 [Rhodovibrio sp.]|nr:hypothetical protein [Rhodovibrio sp.]